MITHASFSGGAKRSVLAEQAGTAEYQRQDGIRETDNIHAR